MVSLQEAVRKAWFGRRNKVGSRSGGIQQASKNRSFLFTREDKAEVRFRSHPVTEQWSPSMHVDASPRGEEEERTED